MSGDEGRQPPTNAVSITVAGKAGAVTGTERPFAEAKQVVGLEGHYLRWVVGADLLRRLGRLDDARRADDRALRCAPNDVERRFLTARRAGLVDFGGRAEGR